MRVRDLMTSPVQVIGPDAPAWEAVGLMRSRRVRRLPVVDGDTLVGIVTWTDVVRVRPPAIGGRWHVPSLAAGVLVRHLMTSTPITVSPETRVEEAAALMRRHKIGGLPVVEGGRLVGIITESDLLEALVEIFGTGPGEVRLHIPVASITIDLARIVAELARVGVPVLSVNTVRARRSAAVEVVVRDRDGDRARAVLYRLPPVVDAERLLSST